MPASLQFFGQSHGVRGRRSRPALYRNANGAAMKPVVPALGADPPRLVGRQTRPGAPEAFCAISTKQNLRAHRFRYGLLVLSFVTVAFIVATSFLRAA